MIVKYIKAVLILLSLTFNSYGQNILTQGDPHIKTNWLNSSHDFYRNVITDTNGYIKYDFMMENFCTVDTLQKRITFARSRQVPPGSFSTDTSVTDLNFKPIRMHEIHQQRQVSFDMTFNEKEALVKTTRSGTTTIKNYPMESGYFEDNMIEYIFGCLQLEKGKTYVMNNFNPATPGNDPYTISYVFDDAWIPTADIKINCTVLYFTHGTTSGYIWIDKNSHKVLKTLGKSKDYSYILTRE